MEERIKKVLDHIEEHLHVKQELKDLAGIACLSPSQFHRQFKRQTGRTPFKFVEEMKMNQAYRVIMEEDWMIQELSDRFGYKDYETFTRAFKKYFQLSPDDLKSIVAGVKKQTSFQEGQELMIMVLDSPDDNMLLADEIKGRLKKLQIDKNLNDSQLFKIAPKDLQDDKKASLIKNKFALTKDDKLWKLILNKG
ncbi:MAG: AraC family transcriptional regulator [Bacteroidota bacterium]